MWEMVIPSRGIGTAEFCECAKSCFSVPFHPRYTLREMPGKYRRCAVPSESHHRGRLSPVLDPNSSLTLRKCLGNTGAFLSWDVGVINFLIST